MIMIMIIMIMIIIVLMIIVIVMDKDFCFYVRKKEAKECFNFYYHVLSLI